MLIIEDDVRILREVCDWFQFEGYEVVSATNGREGLDAAEQHHPDLILCDITMPVMDGHEVLISLRSTPELSTTPFIFLTAAADRAAVRAGMTLGADDYLTKPFSHVDLLNAVQAQLHKHTTLLSRAASQTEVMTQLLNAEHERAMLRSRLMALFSHDFRNPLSSILTSSNILRRYNDRLTDDKRRHHLDRIDGSVQQLLNMLDEMLMTAEIESGRMTYDPQALDLSSFLEDCAEDMRLLDGNSHPIIVSNTVHGLIEADPKLLRHMLNNLIGNAMKYSASGAEVRITAEAGRDQLHLAVHDQGIGIPADSQHKLFEPFYRAPNAKGFKGTGLGLNVVKECAECHHGHVSVVSAEGEGSTFTITLPYLRM